MSISPGTRIGPYVITAQIGVGGMGEVYRATDTKLKRDVAIKVLPDALAHDTDRLARFEREARVLASLNHPHIAQIHGLEEADGVKALVLELVEGPTLADRIAKGAIPIDEALPIAKQIAEALEAAHEQGIIHRDLKPANIKVRPDGTVKVLDFGLAKAMEPAAGSSPSVSMSPTITTPAMTYAGTILGTAAYMSPEQARGKVVDKRADIWAFGCVLYEMLTSQRAFGGKDVTDVLSRVLQREPDFGALPTRLSPALATYLRCCLQKNPRQRVQAIGDVRLALEGAFETAAPQMSGPVLVARWRRVVALAAGALVVAAVGGGAVWVGTRTAASSAPELRLDITTPPTEDPVSVAISPDGHRVVFAATVEGHSQLWVRSLDVVLPQPLAGTDNATYPFWSPDSRSVGFFAEAKLKRIDIAGGSVQALADVGGARGGAWNRDGTILFAPSPVGPIYRIAAAGGQPTALTQLETPAQTDHRSPQFLPDGRHFLYYARGTPEGRGVYVGDLDGAHSPRLVDADAAAVYAATGHILFVRQRTLFAARFDVDRLALVGNPLPVAQQVIVNDGVSLAALSTSAAGPIIYRAGSTAPQLVWIDRSGKAAESIGDPDSIYLSPSLSPDGRWVAVGRNVNGLWDISLIDTARGVSTRVTSDPAIDMSPVWAPDGSHIVFSSARKGPGFSLYTTLVSGPGREALLLETAAGGRATDWSADGRFLLYQELRPTTGSDLWALPMDGNKKPFPVAQSMFSERAGQFSADGKWIAYESDESGRSEIYVQPFPGPGDKTQVSTTGGAQVRRRSNARELFYIALDGRLMAVPMQFPSNRGTVDAGRPVPLFATHLGFGVLGFLGQQYAVARDGQRFLMNTGAGDTRSISVILNWAPKA